MIEGYIEMKREYIKPEAEMMQFVEVEELMTGSMGGSLTENGTTENIFVD